MSDVNIYDNKIIYIDKEVGSINAEDTGYGDSIVEVNFSIGVSDKRYDEFCRGLESLIDNFGL